MARSIGIGPTLILGKMVWIIGSLLVVVAGYTDVDLAYVITGQLLTGVGVTLYIVTQISLRQALTPTNLMGRVTGARRFILFGTAVLGAALGGILGEMLGVQATLLVGAGVLGVELLLIVLSPIRNVYV